MLRISHGNGSPTAKIFFLKDSPSFDEVKHQEMFADSAGFDFKKMMIEASINFSDTYATCLTLGFRQTPLITTKRIEAQKLFNSYYKENNMFLDSIIQTEGGKAFTEIEAVSPNVIVPIGPASLYLLTKESSISTWRGSLMFSERFNCKVIPTYSPQQVQRMYAWRYQVVRDLQRILHESEFPEIRLPKKVFKISPNYAETMAHLDKLIRLADNG